MNRFLPLLLILNLIFCSFAELRAETDYRITETYDLNSFIGASSTQPFLVKIWERSIPEKSLNISEVSWGRVKNFSSSSTAEVFQASNRVYVSMQMDYNLDSATWYNASVLGAVVATELFNRLKSEQEFNRFYERLNKNREYEYRVNERIAQQYEKHVAGQIELGRLRNIGLNMSLLNSISKGTSPKLPTEVSSLLASSLNHRVYSYSQKYLDHADKIAAGSAFIDDINPFLKQTEILFNQKDRLVSEKYKRKYSQYFNSEGILNPTEFGRKENPLINDQPLTKQSSFVGQAVRRLTNSLQSQWIESKELNNFSPERRLTFLNASLALRYADNSIATEGLNRYNYGFLQTAEILINFAGGFSAGLVHSVSGVVDSLPLLADAIQKYSSALVSEDVALQTTVGLVRSIPAISNQIIKEYCESYEKLASGTAYERGEALGRFALDLVSAATFAGGTLRTISSAKTALQIAKIRKASLFAEATNVSARSLGKELLQEFRILQKIPGEELKNLNILFKTNPTKARELGEYLHLLSHLNDAPENILRASLAIGTLDSQNARNYVRRLAIARVDSIENAKYIQTAEDFVKIGQTYSEYERIFSEGKLTISKFDDEVWRAVDRYVDISESKNGKSMRIENSEAAVYKMHRGMTYKTQRYGLPGREGNAVMSAGIGGDLKTGAKVVFDEIDSYDIKKKFPDLALEKTRITVDQVLDLSLTQNQTMLKMEKNLLVIDRSESDAYQVTNILGDLAEVYNFKAIRAPSAASDGGEALHLLPNSFKRKNLNGTY